MGQGIHQHKPAFTSIVSSSSLVHKNEKTQPLLANIQMALAKCNKDMPPAPPHASSSRTLGSLHTQDKCSQRSIGSTQKSTRLRMMNHLDPRPTTLIQRLPSSFQPGRYSEKDKVFNTTHHVIERLLSVSNFQRPQPFPLSPPPVSSTQETPALAPNRLPKCTPLPSPGKIQLQRLASRAGVSERTNKRQTGNLDTMHHAPHDIVRQQEEWQSSTLGQNPGYPREKHPYAKSAE
jgi:hypothetical protein